MTTREDIIPHYVMRLEDDHAKKNSNNTGRRCLAKALFAVPHEFAVALTAYPVLCRGSSFVLTLDADALTTKAAKTTTVGKMKQQRDTAFLSTVFESPFPEDTAKEIALRLTVRMEHHVENNFQVMGAGDFGLGL
jgi:hypothetical protein